MTFDRSVFDANTFDVPAIVAGQIFQAWTQPVKPDGQWSAANYSSSPPWADKPKNQGTW
jgi:hypothetical protein